MGCGVFFRSSHHFIAGDIRLGTLSLGADTFPRHQGAEALAAVAARGFQPCGAGGPGNLGASARNEQAGLGSSSSLVPGSRSCRRQRRCGAGALAPSGALARTPGNFRIPAVRRGPADWGAVARERQAQAAIFRNDDRIVRGPDDVLPGIHALRQASRHLSAGATVRLLAEGRSVHLSRHRVGRYVRSQFRDRLRAQRAFRL